MTPPTAVPEDLFEAARLGDPAAILCVLEQAQPEIRRYARATCARPAEAEDAAQEALWLLFRHLGTIRSFVAFSGWLFSVVRRECLRLARKVGREHASADPATETALLARGDVELQLDVAAALEALPTHYREIALMRDAREMTIDEIAATLGITRQAAKARLHRARVLLREYLLR